jgi:diguanylate cyclase (GGDEF)-like protein
MDMHTLHVEHAVFLGLYTVLTFINSWMHRDTRGVFWFPVYNLFGFIGSVLIALRGHIPDSISIFVGDLFFPIAYFCLHRAVTEFFGEDSRRGITGWHLQLGLTLATAIGIAQYGLINPNTKNRLLVFSLLLSIQLALIAVVIFRNTSGAVSVSAGLMGVVVALISLGNVVRFIGLVVHGAPANYLRGGPFLTWTVLNNSALQGAVTVSFVWMTAAVLRHDLQIQASTDPLTGLLNRRAIERAAETEIILSRQHHVPLSAILIDLDNFKLINDSFGHKQGDAVLIAVARCLHAHVRSVDRVARIGGDEFAILLPHTSVAAAVEIAQRLRTSFEELCVGSGEEVCGIHASFGVAEVQNTHSGWSHLMAHCDKALYAVKDDGGNSIRHINADLAAAQ